MRDIFTLGLALFAMIFGSGNVIFPPYLGMRTGGEWLIATAGFLLVDILVAVFAIVVMAKNDEGLHGITQRTGRIPSRIIGIAIIMCIGPLICIPRACSVTYDMIVGELMGVTNTTWQSWVFTIIFFGLTWILAVRPGKICDYIGNILTPILILSMIVLIVKGIGDPISMENFQPLDSESFKAGVLNGYQSMDLFGALNCGAVALATAKTKGYTNYKTRVKVLGLSSIVCLVFMVLATIGMAYLGSQVTDLFAGVTSQAELIIKISKELFQGGAIIIALVASLACFTTAVGLSGGTALYFTRIFKFKDDKRAYFWIVTACCIFGMFVANLGLENIVKFASPILSLIFPLAVVLVILSYFTLHIKCDYVFIVAVTGAFVSNIFLMIDSSFTTLEFVHSLPLYSYGFGWLCPAILCGMVGFLFSNGRDHRQKYRVWQLNNPEEDLSNSTSS